MKIPKSTIHILVGLESVLLVAVLVISLLHPIADGGKEKDDTIPNASQVNSEMENQFVSATESDVESDTETIEFPEGEPVVFAQEIQDKVAGMTLEQKVAQMFVTTPEQLTDMRQVTATGDTSKAAMMAYPVGGLVYSSLNFEGTVQTASMTEGIQEYCKTELGTPIFLMVKESGGADGSALASLNGFAVEASAQDVGSQNDTQMAVNKAANISAYMLHQGINTNMGICADLTAGVDAVYDAQTFSTDAAVAGSLVSATISAYRSAGVVTVMSMFPGESTGNTMAKDLTSWEAVDKNVYQAGITAGTDMLMVSNGYAECLTGDAAIPCCMSANLVKYIRGTMQYQGILITDSLGEEHIQQNYPTSEAAIYAINAGMDMIYCPTEFKSTYQAVLDAVRAGGISEETINQAVMRILTCKAERL